jgi:hypothetical protein
VDSASLTEGKYYAFREKRAPGTPVIKVKLLAKVGRGGKIRIRYEEGSHPGLEEYVSTRQLIVPWGERKAFQRDEERLECLKEHERQGIDPAVVTAIETVLAATGESWVEPSGWGIDAPIDPVERVMRRAGLEGKATDLNTLSFVDRFGHVHIPMAGAEKLARSFAAAEPEAVTLHIEAEESEMRARGYDPGDRFYHDYWRQQRPGFALARQWAGFEEELESLRKEIGRLRGLVQTAMRELESAGAQRAAWKLRRALDGS